MLPSSDSDIYGTLREIGLLGEWTEDEFLTRLASERKTVRSRDEALRTSEAILRILNDRSRPDPELRFFEDGSEEAAQILSVLSEASPELAARVEFVDEAWEWDAYEDDEAREDGAELDERFGAPCRLALKWNGEPRQLFYRTIADLCRLLNDLFRGEGVATRLYVVSQRGRGRTVLILDEERVRKLNASAILQPDEANLSIA